MFPLLCFTSSSCVLLPPGRRSSPDAQHLVSLGSLLDDQHWHDVMVEHHSTHLNLTVDKNTLWVQIPPRFTHWDHDQVCLCRCAHRHHKHPHGVTVAQVLQYKMWFYVRVMLKLVSVQMSVGADRALGSWRSVGSHRNFKGCLENLVYNGVNLVDLAKQEDQRVTVKVNRLTECR